MVERIVKPTKERRRHGSVTRADTMPDAAGNIGDPFRAESLLAYLERNGDISAPKRAAGEEFHRLFHRAALDPLKAADVSRIPRGYGGVASSSGSERAYEKVTDALTAMGGLGSPCGDCAFYVLGLDLSLRKFAARLRWRGSNHIAAKAVLIITLDRLAKHFGYGG